MMSVAAYEAATIGSNLPFAATIGIILLVVTLVTLMLYQTFVGRLNRSAAAIRSA